MTSVGGSTMSVEAPKMRAYVNGPTTDAVELRFTYQGPTSTQEPLASGASRMQLGLKLRAADACNLVYVIWRVAPATQLVVSVKSNEGQHSSAACGNHGYRDIRAEFASSIPHLTAGDKHRLRAGIRADELSVFVDDSLVWRGHLPAEAIGLEGPVGLRTDNVNLLFEVGVENASAPARAQGSEACTTFDE